MPVTSLPGPHGIGDLGPAAYRFVDFLAGAGQRWWQMLPINPTGAGNSPYNSYSAFAGSPLLISLERLAQDGLLDRSDLRPAKGFSRKAVNYNAALHFKKVRLQKAFERFEKRRSSPEKRGFREFCASHERWLQDNSLFFALRKSFRDCPWTEWPHDLRSRKKGALQKARRELDREIRYQDFLQYQFHRQWAALRAYCRTKRVGLIGDIPIFVAHESVDVWAHPEIFFLDDQGRPSLQTGVPPDCFSRTGQIWRTPLYRWEVLKKYRYSWWIERFRAIFERFDAARIDHFIGFHRAWAVPGRAKTAEKGHWEKGPGPNFFKTLFEELGPLELIAEDLGKLTPEVKELRIQFKMPGMRVLQFAFGNDQEAKNYRPEQYDRQSVVYTGTHDNDTTVGWFRETGSQEERKFALKYLMSNGREVHWDMIRAALMSLADTAIIPMQDLLGLDSKGRMNFPGTSKGNWEWRMTTGMMDKKIACRLRRLTEKFERSLK